MKPVLTTSEAIAISGGIRKRAISYFEAPGERARQIQLTKYLATCEQAGIPSWKALELLRKLEDGYSAMLNPVLALI